MTKLLLNVPASLPDTRRRLQPNGMHLVGINRTRAWPATCSTKCDPNIVSAFAASVAPCGSCISSAGTGDRVEGENRGRNRAGTRRVMDRVGEGKDHRRFGYRRNPRRQRRRLGRLPKRWPPASRCSYKCCAPLSSSVT